LDLSPDEVIVLDQILLLLRHCRGGAEWFRPDQSIAIEALVLSEDIEPFCHDAVTTDFLGQLVRKVPRTLSVTTDDQEPPTAYLRAAHGWSCWFEPQEGLFAP
jgi:hypothetical protein